VDFGDALGIFEDIVSHSKPSDPVTNPVELLRELTKSSSKRTIAEKLGITPKTVSRWISGQTEPPSFVASRLRELAGPKRDFGPIARTFRFIDLFAGIGGFRMAFERAGGMCVFTSEWNEFAQATYRANFQLNHEVVGDITKVPASSIPAHDVLLGGFPCQPFSLAGVVKKESLGRSHGFLDETQGTLFFDVARIIKARRPRAFVLENVKNLVSHDKGRTFRIIRDTLTDLNYNVEFKVVDAQAWVPQHRERIFIIGFDRDLGVRFDFSRMRVPTRPPKLGIVLHPEDGSEPSEPPYTVDSGKVAPRYVLTPKLWEYLQRYAEKHRAAGNGFGFGLFGPNDVARTLSARYYKDGSEVLIRRHGSRPRRLTPRECARLMGFDRPGEAAFHIPVSDTQAYRQFGNAVAVPVVEEIARVLAETLLAPEKRNAKEAK
jgi:DNA (cytosine-5)-methyltransferase 1